jgi:hypothetical protein
MSTFAEMKHYPYHEENHSDSCILQLFGVVGGAIRLFFVPGSLRFCG